MKGRKERYRLRINRYFYRILQLTLGTYLRIKFNIKTSGVEEIDSLSGPFLLLANHVGYWDPFLAGAALRQPVQFVAADANFRSRIQRFGLRLVGAIPKTKAVSDLETIRGIRAVRDAGGVIGVFPEGERNWDGVTLPILPATVKLVKLLRIPVVTAIFAGGYFSHPRWAAHPRRGTLNIHYRLAFTAEQIKVMSVPELLVALQTELTHDEYEWQSDKMVRYAGKRLAEDMENAVFICPSCRASDTLQSQEDVIRCTECGFSARYLDTGYLEPSQAEHGFTTLRDWNRWQLEILRERLASPEAQERTRPLFTLNEVDLSVGYRTDRLRSGGTGTLLLFGDRLEFTGEDGSVRVFPLERASGVAIQYTQNLEFYLDDTLYVLCPRNVKASMYKWDMAIRMLQERSALPTP